jgi:hypothetical protein
MGVRSLGLTCPLVLGACAAASATGGPQPTHDFVQQPIESACEPGQRALSELGLVAHTEFSGDAQAKVTVTNAGRERRRVSPRKVAVCHGPCGAGFSGCKEQRRFEPAERARYDVSLQSGESIELLIDASGALREHACTKAGLVLSLDVDGDAACTDAGSWILLGGPDQG